MEWPSQNVTRGGIFHPAKVKYSPETKQFLKVLMDESKLTMMQRKKVNYSLRSGEPLPRFKSKSELSLIEQTKGPKVLIRPGSSKRRSVNDIVKSGAYERERYIPKHPKVDRDLAKKHLQDLMAFGKDVDPNQNFNNKMKAKKKEKDEEEEEINRFDELVQEIKERQEWLEEMEKLGEGEKHRLVIEQQIQARVREMEKLHLCDSSSPKQK